MQVFLLIMQILLFLRIALRLIISSLTFLSNECRQKKVYFFLERVFGFKYSRKKHFLL